jgi:membrane protease YdiL (CAAX protease family)
MALVTLKEKAYQEAGMAERGCGQKNFSRIGFAMFVLVALTTGLQAGEAALLPLVFPEAEPGPWLRYALLLIPQYAIAMPAAFLVMRRLPRQPLARRTLGAGRFGIVLLICYCILYAGNLAGTVVTQVISALAHRQMANLTAEVISGSDMLTNLITVGILAPVVEELFYRRLLIGRLARYGELTAVAVSGLVFGLVHGNLSQFFYAFGLGLGLGYVYIKTGRLRYTIALHMIINIIGGVLGPFVLNFAKQLAPVFGVAVIGMAIAGLVLLVNNRRKISFRPGACASEDWKRAVFLNEGMLLFFAASAALFIFNTIAALRG